MDAAQQQTIAAATWETEMRAKAREAIATLDSIDVQASPITFTVQGVDVELAWGDNLARLSIGDGSYQLRLPLTWLTAVPAP